MANEVEVQAAVDQALKDQKKKKKKKKLIIFGVILLIIIIAVVVSNLPKNYDFDNPAASVTVDTILNDFQNDSANASEKYSGKVVAVTGQVSSIEESYVIISAYDDDNLLYGVWCYMANLDELKNFKVGETVTIEGVCENTTIFGDVKLEQCVIADKFATVPDYDNPIEIDIDDFIQAYKDNQVSADENYKGKTIQFTAKVTNVTDDYAVVEANKADLWDFDCTVQIYFENIDDLKNVSEGSKVTIVGECYGKGIVYTAKVCRAIVK